MVSEQPKQVASQIMLEQSRTKKMPNISWPKISWPRISWKGVLWCTVVLAILGLGITAGVLNQKRMQLQIALEKATQEKIALQEKLVGVTKAKVSVEQKLAKVEVSLESEKKRAVALDLQLAEARKQEEQVLARIGQQDQLIQELRVKIQQLQIAQKEGGKGIEAGERIASGPISTQEALVELEKIIISHRPPAEGEIIEVSVERPWVVINIGKANDLQEGIILSVLRQGREIGRLQVEEVLEEMASARVLSKEEGVQFQVADAVREL